MASQWKEVGKVKKLCVFPLKSGRRIEVTQAVCMKQGLMDINNPQLQLRDRSFAVYNEKNFENRTARHFPKMVLIEVKAKDNNTVSFNAPGMEEIIVNIPVKQDNQGKILVYQFKEPIPMVDCGDAIAEWFSIYLLGGASGLRLGYNDGSQPRVHVNEVYKEIIEYSNRGLTSESTGINSDIAAVLLVNLASVRDVVKKSGISEINEDSFRPNIVIDDVKLQPFAEDNWRFIKIGDSILKDVIECTRCVMTTVNMETGIRRKDREPLKTLETYILSNGPEKSPVIGSFLEVVETGKISVGDTVYVKDNL